MKWGFGKVMFLGLLSRSVMRPVSVLLRKDNKTGEGVCLT